MSDRLFNFRQAVVRSFYDSTLFRDVAQHWSGIGFVYLLTLHALVMGVVAAGFSLWLTKASLSYPYDFESLLVQAPTLQIEQGEASVDAPEPYTVIDPVSKRAIAVFDTTRPTADTLRETQAMLVVGKHEFLMLPPHEREARLHTYPKDETLVISQDTWRDWAQSIVDLAWLVPLVALPVFVVIMTAYRLVECLIYALVGMLMARRLSADLPYEVLLRLAAVAITPVVVLDVTLMLLGIHFPGWLAFAVAMINLYLAVHANRGESVRQA